MNIIFIKNSKASDSHRLLLNLTPKQTWEENINILRYQMLVFTIHEKI